MKPGNFQPHWHSHRPSARITTTGPETPYDHLLACDPRAAVGGGQPGELHPGRQPLPAVDRGGGVASGPAVPGQGRPGRGWPAGHVAPAPGGFDRARLSGLRPAAQRPDPGGQRRPDESGQALRPGSRRASGVFRGALDPRGDARVHPAQLAHRQDRDDEGAAQAVLQPAQHEDRARRPEHAGNQRHGEPAAREARGSLRNGDPAVGSGPCAGTGG